MSRLRLNVDKRGFTVIEVIIALAIASLILLILFLAVPALQRNVRNQKRKRDARLLYSAVLECISNTNDFASCDQVSDLPFKTNSLSIYTGVHFGATCSNNWPLNCPSPQNPPTVDEPNWLNYLKCNSDGSSLIPVQVSKEFVVGYFIETPGTPATPFVPAGFTGKCLFPEG